jgi:galactokinase
MPARRGLQLNKRPAIRLYSGSRFGGVTVKIMTAAQISKQKRELDERRKKKEELRKYFLITREYIIDLFSTGLTALMRQKITRRV